MIKKTISVLLCIVFCICFMPVIEAQEPVITASFSQDEVTVGDVFTFTVTAEGSGVTNVTAQIDINPYIDYNTSDMGFDTDTMRYTVSFSPLDGPLVIQCTAARKGDASLTLVDIKYTDASGTASLGSVGDSVKVRPVYTPIYTKEDLYNIRNNLNGDYILMNDIVFTQEDFAADGAFYGDGFGWRPIGAVATAPFKGSLNGDGYAIYGLVMNKAYYDFGGLFGVSQGQIEDLRIINAYIDGEYGLNTSVLASGETTDSSGSDTTDTDIDYNDKNVWTDPDSAVTEESLNKYDRTGSSTATVGIICGYNLGTVKNCFTGGTVKGNTYVGGIAGRNTGTLTGCAVNANISSAYAAGSIAGITGSSASVNDCVTQGNVTASVAGGIIGEAKGKVTRVYTLCSVSGATANADFGSGTPTVTEVYAVTKEEAASLTFTGGQWNYDYSMPYPAALADLIAIKAGDVDGDGKIDTTDLAKLKLFLAGAQNNVSSGADVDMDSKTDTTDLAKLKLFLAGA